MKIQIYDTTLRDGTQGESVAFSVQDKLRVARKLDEFGVDYIEGGWPGSNDKDAEFFQRASTQAWRNARIAAWVMASDCVTTSVRWRLQRSVHTPASGVTRNVGTWAQNPTVPSNRADLVRR